MDRPIKENYFNLEIYNTEANFTVLMYLYSISTIMWPRVIDSASLPLQGDLYAMPNRKGRSRVKDGRPHQNSDIDDFISETGMSHRDYSAGNRGHHFRG